MRWLVLDEGINGMRKSGGGGCEWIHLKFLPRVATMTSMELKMSKI